MLMSDFSHNNEVLLKQAANGDPDARDKIVMENTGLVHSVVKRFLGRGHDAEDLFQIGCIGLIKATQNFDQSYGVRFSTYAVPMIMGEIKRFIRDDGIIKVSRHLKETAAKAMNLRASLIDKNGVEPSLKEIADGLNISSAELASAIEANTKPESLYSGPDDESGDNHPLIDRIENGINYENEIVNKLALRQLISELNENEQKLLYLRYFKQKTQSHIADILGISQVQVSRIEKKLLIKMRTKLNQNR